MVPKWCQVTGTLLWHSFGLLLNFLEVSQCEVLNTYLSIPGNIYVTSVTSGIVALWHCGVAKQKNVSIIAITYCSYIFNWC